MGHAGSHVKITQPDRVRTKQNQICLVFFFEEKNPFWEQELGVGIEDSD